VTAPSVGDSHGPPAEVRRVVVAPDVQLHVLTGALDTPGVPVLLVHGLASNARLWDGVAERLATRGHPVASVDQRGHGRSDKPNDGYDFATLTDDLLAVLADLGWQGDRRPWVAGQSWGANVVLELAARHPEATLGLVLVDGGTIELASRFADWPTCEAALAPPPLTGTPAAGFERLIRTHHSDWPESGIAGTLANFEMLADGTIRPWLSREHHMTILHHLWEHRPSARYPLIGVPVLLLPAEDAGNQRWMAGKRDEVARARAALDRSLTRWIAGDHDLHAQHPDVVAELIDAASGPALFS
jgi:pimeloyl-ACP methyl ester carboxylesterase